MIDVRVVWARRWDRLWGVWLTFVLVVLPVLAWVQHLASSAMAGRWLFLVGGAVAFPVGIINGLGIWLGFWN